MWSLWRTFQASQRCLPGEHDCHTLFVSLQNMPDPQLSTGWEVFDFFFPPRIGLVIWFSSKMRWIAWRRKSQSQKTASSRSVKCGRASPARRRSPTRPWPMKDCWNTQWSYRIGFRYWGGGVILFNLNQQVFKPQKIWIHLWFDTFSFYLDVEARRSEWLPET